MADLKNYETEDHLILKQFSPKEPQEVAKKGSLFFQVFLSEGVLEHIGEIGQIEYCSGGKLSAEEPFAIIESTKAATELSFDFPSTVVSTGPSHSVDAHQWLVEIAIDSQDRELFLQKVRSCS